MCEEMLRVVSGHERVFLLLSGGYDSRVVAGILKKLEPQLHTQIECVTWGIQDSRDVVYASRIADWFDWKFHHIPYTAELTWENIERGAIWGGAQVAGFHLHGLSWFQNANPQDLVIAATYGSNIGQGYFSRKHLSQIKLLPVRNHADLLKHSLSQHYLPHVDRDRASAWNFRQDLADVVKHEVNQEENYNRRMLDHCMEYICQYCDYFQAFTSQEVLSYIWSIAPECRVQEVIFHVIRRLDARLSSLPWSHDGVAPDGTYEKDPALRKNHHQLTTWLQKDLRSRLEELYFSQDIRKLGLFSQSSMARFWKTWLKAPDSTPVSGSGETVVQIAALELARRNFHLRAEEWPFHISDLLYDGVREVRSSLRSWLPRRG
jgi:hypothetical protein